jgi:hypothetical protein
MMGPRAEMDIGDFPEVRPAVHPAARKRSTRSFLASYPQITV